MSHYKAATAVRKRVVGYLRVSTQEQADRGYGLPVQRAALEAFCAGEGYELVKVLVDPGVSGTVPLHDREGMLAALGIVQRSQHATRAPVSGLVVARWDRLARDTLQALLIEQEFTKAGAAVLSADGMNGDQTMRELLHVLASAERRALVARLRAGREVKKARGGYSGGRPRIGYTTIGKELAVDEDAAEVIEWAFLRIARDRWSLRRVADHLHAHSALGQRWDAPKLHRIVHHEGYKLGADPIVDPRVYNRAHAVLAGRRGRRHEQQAAA